MPENPGEKLQYDVWNTEVIQAKYSRDIEEGDCPVFCKGIYATAAAYYPDDEDKKCRCYSTPISKAEEFANDKDVVCWILSGGACTGEIAVVSFSKHAETSVHECAKWCKKNEAKSTAAGFFPHPSGGFDKTYKCRCYTTDGITGKIDLEGEKGEKCFIIQGKKTKNASLSLVAGDENERLI